MTCDELAERLTDFLEGDLGAAEEAAAIEHLATCEACETVLAGTRDVMDLAATHGRVTLSSDDRDRLWDRVVGEVGRSVGG